MNNLKVENIPGTLKFEVIALDGKVLGSVEPRRMTEKVWEWFFTPSDALRYAVMSASFHDCIEQACEWLACAGDGN